MERMLKNNELFGALISYEQCIEKTWKLIYDDHTKFHNFVTSSKVMIDCREHLNEIRNNVTNGGLDFSKYSF